MVAMKTFFAILPLFLSVTARPFVVPRATEPLPKDAASLAFDEQNGKIVAFSADGSKLGEYTATTDAPKRRDDAGACTSMSAEDVQKLPGWDKLKQKANDNWGDHKRNVVTNPKEYNDRSLVACVSSDPITLKADKEPQCAETKQSTEGSLVGSSGSVQLSATSGSSYSTSHTVTNTAGVTAGASFTANIGFNTGLNLGGGAVPVAATLGSSMGMSSTFSFSTTFTNSLADAKTETANDQTTTSITQEAPDGKKCHLDFKTKSCTLEGTGKLRLLADGWVWFNYEDKQQGTSHYKWALSVPATLSDDERSTFMEFKHNIKSESKSDYKGVCE